MSLAVGARLGPYEILAPLGAGGMGEVYKARDTRLDRTVAIKILPSADPIRRQRFEREARVVALLNHPHVCTLHDVGHQDGTDFLVMEYLEGQTLADRVKKGALPLDQALQYAIEVAEALDAAHRRGIVHRDLKPSNIMLTKAGAKLLDFGIAAIRATGTKEGTGPTKTEDTLTAEGTVIGTLHYMAPEQLEGREADARSDLFAFGAVLYEMLTGRRAFAGTSDSKVIAAVLESEPSPIITSQPLTPPVLEYLVKRCLSKDPSDRWQTMHDVCLQLKWIAETGAKVLGGLDTAGTAHRFAWAVGAVIAGLVVTGLSWSLIRPSPMAPLPLSRLAVALPFNVSEMRRGPNLAVSISPDGRTIVFVGGTGNDLRLFRRGMDQLRPVPITGTENGHAPFFSSDGRWIGFEAEGVLKKISLAGGPAQRICRIPGGQLQGASWGENGTIVFAGTRTGLFRVSATGGNPQALTTVDQKSGETHSRPAILPGERAALFDAGGRIEIVLLNSGQRRTLTEGSTPRFSRTGHVVFARGSSIWAAPFDVAELEISGEPGPVLDGIENVGAAQFDFSHTGTLAYLEHDAIRRGSSAPGGRLVIVDREGRTQTLPYAPGRYQVPRIAPDGRRLLVRRETDLWLLEIDRPAQTRLTFAEGQCLGIPSVWTHEGTRIAFTSGSGCASIYTQPADSSGAPELFFSGQAQVLPTSWSRSYSVIAVYTVSTATGPDVRIVASGGKQATSVVETHFSERAARFSPDSAWLAYVSDESGRDEVYVRPYPGPGAKVPVSRDGGTEPAWAPNGRELFYRIGDQIVTVPVRAERTLTLGTPQVLFQDPNYVSDGVGNANYDVFPDGQRFVIVQETGPVEEPKVVLVLNWFEELIRLVPTQ